MIARATVNGEPVVLAVERSSFNREVDSSAAFLALNENRAKGPEAFRTAIADVNSTLNWLYVDERDAVYFHSGRYPVRARGVDPDLPSWGTGEWEWQGVLAATEQPFDVNPKRGFMTSWNNKPARGWRAADRNFSYGSVYRSLAFDVRLAPQVKGRKTMTPAEAVKAMADAATVDLRGQTLLPEALSLAKGKGAPKSAQKLLRAWLRAGAHRLDADQDGRYDDGPAVALMDEWFPLLVHAVFDPQLDGLYGLIPVGLDDAPSNSHVGSAYQSGYYGYLQKAMRQALRRRVRQRFQVLRCADGTRAGCAAAVRASLVAAVAAATAKYGSSSPDAWQPDPLADRIVFSPGGLATAGPIPWQNRPTFQQVVQVE